MKVVSKNEFEQHKQEYLAQLKTGIVVIYPTDTVYGIGCNALINNSVKKIRELKEAQHPFSVIVPSKEWIYDNCEVTPQSKEWIDKLPGPYTLILPLKENTIFTADVVPDMKSIGVRIPDHWIFKYVQELGYPLITTSVNEKGRQFMTTIEDLSKKMEAGVDLCIYEGEREGTPSQIIRFDEDETQIIKR